MKSSDLHTKIPITIKIFFDASTLQLFSHVTPIIGTALRLKKLQKEISTAMFQRQTIRLEALWKLLSGFLEISFKAGFILAFLFYRQSIEIYDFPTCPTNEHNTC
jgi:hypothetical protein